MGREKVHFRTAFRLGVSRTWDREQGYGRKQRRITPTLKGGTSHPASTSKKRLANGRAFQRTSRSKRGIKTIVTVTIHTGQAPGSSSARGGAQRREIWRQQIAVAEPSAGSSSRSRRSARPIRARRGAPGGD